jgi:hypothetical protein
MGVAHSGAVYRDNKGPDPKRRSDRPVAGSPPIAARIAEEGEKFPSNAAVYHRSGRAASTSSRARGARYRRENERAGEDGSGSASGLRASMPTAHRSPLS